MRRALTALLAAAALGAALAAPAAAPAQPLIGISDQKASMFADPLYQALAIPIVRLVAPWDAITTETAWLDGWLASARAAGAQVLISFEHRRGDQCPDDPCVAPTVAQYADAFDAFRARYPWVTLVSPWNEANHPRQPTYLNPRRAAEYYNVVRDHCPSCQVVAADVLDNEVMASWLGEFQRFAAGSPQLWGLHNWGDANDFDSDGTRAMLRLVPGQVWLTETGGLVSLRNSFGQYRYAPDEDRAARALRYAIQIARDVGDRIGRVYVYNWQADPASELFFDAALERTDGSARPALLALADELQRGAALGEALVATGRGGRAEDAAGDAPGSGAAGDASRAGGSAAGKPATPATRALPRIAVASPSATKRGVRLRLRCAKAATCRGTLRVVLSGRTVGRARFAVRAGTTRKVEVKLTKAGRRAARRHPGRLKVRVAMR